MTATAFDTLKAAKALEDAGFGEAQVEAVVTTVGDAVREHIAPLASSMATISDGMATKEYVATIADRMVTKEQFAATVDTLATKEYVTAAFAELRADMAVEFKNLYRHLWVMGTSIVGLTVVLIKLLP